MRLEPLERQMVDDFRRRLEAALGSRLAALRVFGSRARGTATPSSDLDVLVLIDARDRKLKRTIIDISEDVNEAHDWEILISPLVMSMTEFDEMRSREKRLALDIDREGIAV